MRSVEKSFFSFISIFLPIDDCDDGAGQGSCDSGAGDIDAKSHGQPVGIPRLSARHDRYGGRGLMSEKTSHRLDRTGSSVLSKVIEMTRSR